MQKRRFLSGILNALIGIVFLCGLSACAIKNPFHKSFSQKNVPQIQSATNSQEAMLNPVNLHQSLQPDLNNPLCPYTLDDPSYRLGAEDEINIQIFGENDLSGKYKLQNSGAINMPLIGESTLSGCTLQQAKQLLYVKFTDGYLVNPDIAISISKHRPFYILGEIREPGRYDYMIDMNLLQAVALAGGFTYRANRKHAKILTGHQNDKPIYKNLPVEEKINPGDVIFIKERFF